MIMRALIGSALAAAAVPAAAELPVAPLPDIYETYNDCLKVAAPSGLSQDALASLGWSRAKTSDNSPPLFFGKADRKTLIMLTSPRGEGLCVVLARIESPATFGEFLKAWGDALPAADNKGVISFSDEGHLVQIRQTGTDQEPALSMAVMTPEKK